jgi:hypothetical protein
VRLQTASLDIVSAYLPEREEQVRQAVARTGIVPIMAAKRLGVIRIAGEPALICDTRDSTYRKPLFRTVWTSLRSNRSWLIAGIIGFPPDSIHRCLPETGRLPRAVFPIRLRGQSARFFGNGCRCRLIVMDGAGEAAPPRCSLSRPGARAQPRGLVGLPIPGRWQHMVITASPVIEVQVGPCLKAWRARAGSRGLLLKKRAGDAAACPVPA